MPVISNQTEKNVTALLLHSFTQLFRLSNNNQSLTVEEVDATVAEGTQFKSIMFTLSLSHCRLVLLLHFLPMKKLPANVKEELGLEWIQDEQQYLDYFCELGNNFCGVACRVLGTSGLSTGMSTPHVLANLNAISTLRSVGIDYETHAGAFSNETLVSCASFCLFVNKNTDLNLNVSIPAAAQEEENLGELEFF